MHWQDIVIAICSWLASAALIPSLVSPDKPAFWSSIYTCAIVSTFGICYATLGLWTAAVSSAVLAGVWLTLAIQKWRKDRRESVKIDA